MNCNECANLLDDYIERELDAKNSVLMETHLASCADCARSFQLLKAEQNLYENYLTNVEAAPQLWIGLQEKLEKTKSPSCRRPLDYFQNLFTNDYRGSFANQFQVAALAIIVVLGVIGFIKYGFSGNQFEQTYVAIQKDSDNVNSTNENEIPDPVKNSDDNLKDKRIFLVKKNQPNTAENPRRKNVLPIVSFKRTNKSPTYKIINSARLPSSDEVVRKAERQYVNAIAVLTRDINRRGAKISSDAFLQAETVLTDLDRTIENTRRAVREQPGDTVAIQYMTAAYAKKVELLREIGSK
jgi:hypothetical protein